MTLSIFQRSPFWFPKAATQPLMPSHRRGSHETVGNGLPPFRQSSSFQPISNMTKMPKLFWIICGVLFAAASVGIHYEVKFVMHQQNSGPVQAMGNVKDGQPAPDFSLPDLSSNTVTLSSYRGQKVVLLDFWATWCGPCRMAMPGLQDLQDKFKDHGLEILSVNQGEAAEQVVSFIQRKKYTFHVVLDQDGAVGGKYSVQGIPTLVLVDKHGVVQWLRVGYSENEDDLRQLVEKLTKE